MPATANYRKDRKQWVVSFHQFGARWQVSEGVKDKADAHDKARLANLAMKEGKDLRPPEKRPAAAALADLPVSAMGRPMSGATTFEEFAIWWMIEEQPKKKATTNTSYESQFRCHIFPAIGDLPLASITRHVVKRMLKDLIGKVSARTGRPLRNKTREDIHADVCAVLEAAADLGLIEANPALRIKDKDMHDPDEIEQEKKVWSPEEADRFLRTCKAHPRDARWYPYFFVALRLGPRFGEQVELRWDKDFKIPGKLHIQRNFIVKPRKKMVLNADGKTYRRERMPEQDRITTTKGKKKRLLDTFEVETVLAEHRAAQRKEAFALGQGQSLVFTGVTGARVSDVTLGRVMATLEKLANVPHITIHGLRHTFASVNLMRGVDIKDVSEQLGHEDIATTERHYRHYIPDDAEAVARRRRMAAEVWKVGGESAKG